VDLFEQAHREQLSRRAPLAARMRPRSLDEFVGQEAIVGEGRLLRRAIEADRLFSSILLWGPPGTGKTTLAGIVARSTRCHFESISAVLCGIPDMRKVMERARERRVMEQQRTLLFVDEVHRWNKAQQDALLPHVEDGTVVLIGATTENPYFEVISALVSRSRVFRLEPLADSGVRTLLERALADPERGYGQRNVTVDDEALRHLVDVSSGDARNALNALELAVESTPPGDDGAIHLDLVVAQESIQRRAVLYDKDGDAHYDTISAFIKSIRGSDPDASLYWLARMLKAGESPRFILRRLVILAGEDVGLADPLGLVVANAAAEAFERIGLPEGIYPLVEATLYLATASKSDSASAFFKAWRAVEDVGKIEVPDHLKDGSRDREALGHGEGYVFPHEKPGHHTGQQYLPTPLLGTTFYTPSDQGVEVRIGERLERWREAQRRATGVESAREAPFLTESDLRDIKRDLDRRSR
jgi:putative ATPase